MAVPYTTTISVWKAGKPDEWGDIVFDAPTVFKAVFKKGGNIKLTDSKGQEFYPDSMYWSRLEVVSGNAFAPNNGDLIIEGDHFSVTDPSSVGAKQIRGQTVFDNSMFGQGVEYLFGTS